MKTQLSKPARSKARYTEEYKQEALELWRNSGPLPHPSLVRLQRLAPHRRRARSAP